MRVCVHCDGTEVVAGRVRLPARHGQPPGLHLLAELLSPWCPALWHIPFWGNTKQVSPPNSGAHKTKAAYDKLMATPLMGLHIDGPTQDHDTQEQGSRRNEEPDLERTKARLDSK